MDSTLFFLGAVVGAVSCIAAFLLAAWMGKVSSMSDDVLGRRHERNSEEGERKQ